MASVIAEIQSQGRTVVGLEGFELESPEIHPRLDLIYDEYIAHRGGASTVVAGWGEDVWVDITLETDGGDSS